MVDDANLLFSKVVKTAEKTCNAKETRGTVRFGTRKIVHKANAANPEKMKSSMKNKANERRAKKKEERTKNEKGRRERREQEEQGPSLYTLTPDRPPLRLN